MSIDYLLEDVKQIRRALHQIPEFAFDLYKTQQAVKHYLTQFGYEFEEVAHTGLIAVKKGKQQGAIAFRSDMDALMVDEQTEVEFASTHQGKMHACGHDGHMAILLGFAKYVSELKQLNKSIVFIFQPAEEGPGGAKPIIEAGIFEKYQIEKVFGLHIYPNLEEGKIGLVDGAMMAQAGEFDLTIHAQSCHGAMPHKGIDALLVASHLIQSFQSVVSRNVDPLEGAVLTVGKISGGEARNIVAGSVTMNGTIRAFEPSVYELIKNRMKKIINGLEVMFDVEIHLEIRDLYPPVVNDSNLYQFMTTTLDQEEMVHLRPMMISEDFSYYQQVVPGFFMMLGARNEEKGFIHPLHSCYFNFDEKILLHGIQSYIKICKGLNVFE